MPYLLLAVVLWGSSFIAGKYAYNMVDPVLLVQIRLLISVLAMLPWLWQARKKLTRANLPMIALLGFMTFPLTFLLQFFGLWYTSAASAATMLGAEPMMLLLVGATCFKERLGLVELGLALLAFVGVVLVVWQPQDANISIKGCALVLASALAVAFWLRLSKLYIQQLGSMHYTALTLFFGAISCLPFTLIFSSHWQLQYEFKSVLALIYLGIACSVITSWAWNKGVAQSSANFAAMMLTFEPIFAVLFAMVLLGERLSPSAMMGTLIIIAATIITAKRGSH